MIAPHAIQRHPSNAQPRLRVLHSGCRRACWAMMMRQARRSSAIQHYTVRCGFLSQRSYVAPSRQRRSSSKRPRKELTYCPIYGFKSFLICAKELTPALFCGSGFNRESNQATQELLNLLRRHDHPVLVRRHRQPFLGLGRCVLGDHPVHLVHVLGLAVDP